MYADENMLGQKNELYVSQEPRHLQPPASKIFIAFPVFTLNCQFRSAVISRHFVC